MKTPSAYQLEHAMSALQAARARLLAEDPDLAGDEAALTELLGSECKDAEQVVHSLLRAAVHAEHMETATRDWSTALTERATRYKNRAERLRHTAHDAMMALEKSRIELPDLTASIKATAPKVVITDPDALPDEYVRIKREPNKTAIKSDIEQGVIIPGASMSNGGSSLQLRVK